MSWLEKWLTILMRQESRGEKHIENNRKFRSILEVHKTSV